MINWIILVVFCVAVLGVAVFFLLYIFAATDTFATFMPGAGIKAVSAGKENEAAVGFIVNVPNHKLSDDPVTGNLVPSDKDNTDDLSLKPVPKIGNWLKVVWISWFPPARHLHFFDMEWDELREGGAKIGDEQIVHGGEGYDYRMVHIKETVSTLHWRHDYAKKDSMITLEDGFTMWLIYKATLEVTNPHTVMFVYKNGGLDPVFAAIENALANIARNLPYKSQSEFGKDSEEASSSNSDEREVSWVNLDKRPYNDEGEETEFFRCLTSLNDRLSSQFGRIIVRLDIYDFDLLEEHKEAEKAIQAARIAQHNAKAAEAEGRGEGKRLKRRYKALKNKGLREVYKMEQWSQAVQKHKGSLVLGGSTLPTLPIEDNTEDEDTETDHHKDQGD